ncbi:DUF2079 domain-containing protein [Skermania sp. ID1734]|uniref:DUF2079 domain-containing protein n=1 Tax=Skermania sp. ID1734 TaxID=2597516 RepID=UPI00117DFF18|nr:DUF2079 domain-containing protein [Skermania sp. ID1734]TSD99699.1 DUF2079 domain-containing protein [Skermania sp. ID1734]
MSTLSMRAPEIVVEPTAGRRDSPPARRMVWLPAAAFVVLAAVYSLLGLRNQAHLATSGYDLGIFVQEVAAYAHGHAPWVPLLGSNALGDHFSPLMAVLAPVYRVFPSPDTLMVAQAVLFAVGVIPLSRWALRRLGSVAAVVVSLGYGLSWGLQSAANFDFHEIALAVPLLAFSVTALGNRHWRAGLLWALPLVFVKEDLGLTVFAIGAFVAWFTTGRTRWWGVVAACWGVAWTALAVTVIIPALSPNGTYGQASKLGSGGVGSALDSAWHGLLSGDDRGSTVFLLLLITGFVALRSPLIVLALPTLGWRFISNNSNFWGPDYHYSAVLMPIMFAALIDALVRGRDSGRIGAGARKAVLAVVFVVAVAGLPVLPLSRLMYAQTWRADPQRSAITQLTQQIPPGSTIAASNNIAPQLVSNYSVTIFPQLPQDHVTPDWIMVNLSNPSRWPKDPAGDKQAIADAETAGYTVRGQEAGIVLLQR